MLDLSKTLLLDQDGIPMENRRSNIERRVNTQAPAYSTARSGKDRRKPLPQIQVDYERPISKREFDYLTATKTTSPEKAIAVAYSWVQCRG